MRENESESQPALTDGEQEPAGSWGTNGSEPASGSNDADAAAAAEHPATDATEDDSAAFLADLARVMQAAATAERTRIAEDSERRRSAQLDLIRARETSEAEELGVVAEGDIKAIDSWADTEIERIQSERERRITSRRGELAQRLDDHRLLIGREVDAVEAAVAAYRTEVEAYFSRLDAETDPVAIAREAGRRPQFPELGTVPPVDAAAGDAMGPTDESGTLDGDPPPGDDAPVGVMDPNAPADAIADSEPSGSVADVEVDATVEPDAGVESLEPAEPADTKAKAVESSVASNAVAPRSSSALMGSWFRRGDDAAGRPDADD